MGSIDVVWASIKAHEGEVFKQMRGIGLPADLTKHGVFHAYVDARQVAESL